MSDSKSSSNSPSSEATKALEGFMQNARLEQLPPGLESRVLASVARDQVARIRSQRLKLIAGFSSAAAVLGLCFWIAGRAQVPSVGPEAVAPVASAPNPPGPISQPSAAKRSPVICDKRATASGNDPLIDDFEYEGATPPVREARRGSWEFITDKETGKKGPFYSLTSLLPAPERAAKNQRAMHLAIDHLRDWGASLEYPFHPSCYDASVYSGIRFRAKGGTRLQVAARQPEVIPPEYGGSCEENCYISHLKVIDLADEWTEYEVPFSQLHKRGYDSQPLDPSRIHSLQFSVQSEDTPADLWIDDIAWLK